MIFSSLTPRGFREVLTDDGKKVAQESSAVGDYEDSLSNPGSSFLWIGDAHLNREDVHLLREMLGNWLDGERLCRDIEKEV